MPPISIQSLLAVATIVGLGAAVPQAFAQGKDLEAVEGFYTPMAATFADDGRTFFVANAARGDYGMLAGRGAISRCVVSGDGQVTVTAAQFAKDVNAPVDLAILPGPTAVSPAGALIVAVGGSWVTDIRGRLLETDQDRGTGLVVIDAEKGTILGRIFLGQGSLAAPLVGHPVLDPISIAVDPAGNVFLADVAARGSLPDSPGTSRPGIWKLTPAAIDALLQNVEPAAGSVTFLPVRAVPTGVAWSKSADALIWVTGNDALDGGGGVFLLPQGDFSDSEKISLVAKDLTSLSGIGLTPKGSVLVARNSGDVMLVRGRRGRSINFRERPMFLSPGQIAVTTLDDGRVFVVLPEASGGGSRQWRHSVRTFVLPDDY